MAEQTIQTANGGQTPFALITQSNLVNGYPGTNVNVNLSNPGIKSNQISITSTDLVQFRILELGISLGLLSTVPKYSLILTDNFRNQIEPYNGTGSSSGSQTNQFWS